MIIVPASRHSFGKKDDVRHIPKFISLTRDDNFTWIIVVKRCARHRGYRLNIYKRMIKAVEIVYKSVKIPFIPVLADDKSAVAL